MKEAKDILGIGSYGKALETAVEKSSDGVQAFLGKLCVPAAAEFGLMLKDRVHLWRLNNVIRWVKKAEGRFSLSKNEPYFQIHPRLAMEMMEGASWQNDEGLLDMWAGLLKATSLVDGQTDENLIFTNILKSITSLQSNVINQMCSRAPVWFDKNGLILAGDVEFDFKDFKRDLRCDDVQRIDRELDHLRSLEMLPTLAGASGFTVDQENFDRITLQPSALALHFYCKVQGEMDLQKFYKHQIKSGDRPDSLGLRVRLL